MNTTPSREQAGTRAIRADAQETHRHRDDAARLGTHVGDAIYTTDNRGIITYWDRTAAVLFSRPPEEAVGRSVDEVVGSRFDEFACRTLGVAAAARLAQREFRCVRPDGSELLVEEIVIALDLLGGVRPGDGYLVVSRDVSARRQAQEQVRESERQQAEARQREREARWRILFDEMPIPTMVLRKNGPQFHVADYNTAMRNFRPTVTDYLDKPANELFAANPDIVAMLEGCVRSKGRMRHTTLFRGDGSGDERYVDLAFAYAEPQHVIMHCVDVTEQRRAELEVHTWNLELENRVAERTSELATANRDLRDEIIEHARTENALREREQLFRLLADNAQDLVYRLCVRPAPAFEYVSPSALPLTGYAPDEFYATPQALFDLVHPDDRPALDAALRGDTSVPNPLILRWLHRDGHMVWMEQKSTVVRNRSGEIIAVEGIARDITERLSAEQALRSANDNLTEWTRKLEDSNREMGALYEMGDLLEGCLTVGEAFQVVGRCGPNLFPESSGALYLLTASKERIEMVAHWGDLEPVEQLVRPDQCRALRGRGPYAVDAAHPGPVCDHLHPDRADLTSICAPMTAQGETLGVLSLQFPASLEPTEGRQRLVVGVAEHIALALASLRLLETLRDQAIRDPLTGLFNRRYMAESLERELHRAARRQSTIGVVMLDFDHFKRFNDIYGHQIGDAVLRDFGRFLQTHVRGEDIAARYGGEEFVLVMPDATLKQTSLRADEVRRGVKQLQIRHEGQTYRNVSVSLGVAVYPEHGVTAESVLRTADKALYRAKALGRDRVEVGTA